METRSHTFFRFFLLFTLPLMLISCSDSDPTDPGGNDPPAETTAPLVTDFDPETGDINIALDATLNVEFSEPMLPASATGNITLSSGTVDNLVWSENNTQLAITATGWSEGQEITLTIETGLTDVAGNALPQAFSVSFFTFSSVPVMMAYDLHADPQDVPLNAAPTFRFSEPMDLASLFGATTVTYDDKAVPGFSFTPVGDDDAHLKLSFTESLVSLATYTIDISTDALSQSHDNLSEAIHLTFLTGSALDTTAPTIVSSVPARGSVAPADLDRIILNFSESVDPNQVQPDTLSGFFHIFAPAEPVWNDNTDQLTVYLTGPLPAGVDLFVDFDLLSIYDWAGNGNDQVQSVRFSIEGEAVLFPVREDLAFIFEFEEEGDGPGGAWEDGGLTMMVFDDPEGPEFERFLYHEIEGAFTELDDHWFMSQDDDGSILFNGFGGEDGGAGFNPAVNYLPNPLPTFWDGDAQFMVGENNAWLEFSGQVTLTGHRLNWFNDDGTKVVLENVVQVRLDHSLSWDEAGDDIFNSGSEMVYICPGLGFVAWGGEDFEYEEGTLIEEVYSEYFLRMAGPRGMFE